MNSKKGVRTLVASLILYLLFNTGCTHDNELPPTPFEKADPGIGGIMYDKFWSAEAQFDQNDPNINTFKNNADFFRCKQCHAWDGLGNAGSYIGRAPKTTRPNVAAFNLYEMVQEHSAQELFEAMKETAGRRDIAYDLSQYDPNTNNTEGDKMPNFSQILSDAQIWDIVKFLKEGIFDVSELYDGTYTGTYPTGSASYSNLGLATGDAVNGKVYYSANCAGCHGADGTRIPLDDKGVGGFTRSKAYEVQHKVKYGQLGSSMVGEFDITLDEMRDLYKALADITDFPDLAVISYANNMQPFFDAKCIGCHNGGTIPLDLTTAVSYSEIINGGYVDTGNPANSILYTKIAPGGSMESFSSPAETAMTLNWIQLGAQNN
jgi:mono/diheme cytochrome c family protein